jgi:hypothetical protein
MNPPFLDFSHFSTIPSPNKDPEKYIQNVINCNPLQSKYLDLELIHNKNFRPGMGIRTMSQLEQHLNNSSSNTTSNTSISSNSSNNTNTNTTKSTNDIKDKTDDGDLAIQKIKTLNIKDINELLTSDNTSSNNTTNNGINKENNMNSNELNSNELNSNEFANSNEFNFEIDKNLYVWLKENNCSFILSIPGSNAVYSIGQGTIPGETEKKIIYLCY